MRKKVTLITGANGEVGHGLIERLSALPEPPAIVAIDKYPLDANIARHVENAVVMDILDTQGLDFLLNEYEIGTIFHLAAVLSTHAEFHPEAAHRVNVQGTVNLLKLAVDQGLSRGEPVVFLYPSSIAAYGLPDVPTKNASGAVPEDAHLYPITMYGCNKLYCEHLGRYYKHYYQQLSATPDLGVDFRGVRFPGLISAVTVPSGGTSDYAPEMLHAAARGEPYRCFVREDTTIPFMAMPDAVKALLDLAAAPRERLTREIYNVRSFSVAARQFAAMVLGAFPAAAISYDPASARQGIVDSWPADIDDSAARRDWGWQPAYDARRTFDDYLVPTIRARYHQTG